MHDDHNVNDDYHVCTSELESVDTMVFVYENMRRWNAATNANVRDGKQLSGNEVANSTMQPTRMHDNIDNDNDDDDDGTRVMEPVGNVE